MSPVIPKDVVGKVADADEAGSFVAIPDGLYGARLMNCEATETKAGDPMWKWEFEILEGQGHDGRRFWSNSTFGEKALPFFKKTLAAFGVDGDDEAVLDALDTDTLLGQWVTLSISTKAIPEGNKNAGRLTNNVDEVLPYDGPDEVGD
jgi:hypothetical protein